MQSMLNDDMFKAMGEFLRENSLAHPCKMHKAANQVASALWEKLQADEDRCVEELFLAMWEEISKHLNPEWVRFATMIGLRVVSNSKMPELPAECPLQSHQQVITFMKLRSGYCLRALSEIFDERIPIYRGEINITDGFGYLQQNREILDLISNIDCYINNGLQWSDVWAGAPGSGPFQQHAACRSDTNINTSTQQQRQRQQEL